MQGRLASASPMSPAHPSLCLLDSSTRRGLKDVLWPQPDRMRGMSSRAPLGDCVSTYGAELVRGMLEPLPARRLSRPLNAQDVAEVMRRHSLSLYNACRRSLVRAVGGPDRLKQLFRDLLAASRVLATREHRLGEFGDALADSESIDLNVMHVPGTATGGMGKG